MIMNEIVKAELDLDFENVSFLVDESVVVWPHYQYHLISLDLAALANTPPPTHYQPTKTTNINI